MANETENLNSRKNFSWINRSIWFQLFFKFLLTGFPWKNFTFFDFGFSFQENLRSIFSCFKNFWILVEWKMPKWQHGCNFLKETCYYGYQVWLNSDSESCPGHQNEQNNDKITTLKYCLKKLAVIYYQVWKPKGKPMLFKPDNARLLVFWTTLMSLI